MRPLDPRNVSEAEVLDCLTSRGQYPLEYCFLLRKAIRGWNFKFGMMMAYMIDDRLLADACRAYLRAKGLAFDTPEELERHVLAHHWPNLEQLLPQIESMKQWMKR